MTNKVKYMLTILLLVLSVTYLIFYVSGLIHSFNDLMNFDITSMDVPEISVSTKIAQVVGVVNLITFIYYIFKYRLSKMNLWWVLLLPIGSIKVAVQQLVIISKMEKLASTDAN